VEGRGRGGRAGQGGGVAASRLRANKGNLSGLAPIQPVATFGVAPIPDAALW